MTKNTENPTGTGFRQVPPPILPASKLGPLRFLARTTKIGVSHRVPHPIDVVRAALYPWILPSRVGLRLEADGDSHTTITGVAYVPPPGSRPRGDHSCRGRLMAIEPGQTVRWRSQDTGTVASVASRLKFEGIGAYAMRMASDENGEPVMDITRVDGKTICDHSGRPYEVRDDQREKLPVLRMKPGGYFVVDGDRCPSKQHLHAMMRAAKRRKPENDYKCFATPCGGYIAVCVMATQPIREDEALSVARPELRQLRERIAAGKCRIV